MGAGGYRDNRAQFSLHPQILRGPYLQCSITRTHRVSSTGPNASHVVAGTTSTLVRRDRGPNEILLGSFRGLHTVRQPTKDAVIVNSVNRSRGGFPVRVVAAIHVVTWRWDGQKGTHTMCEIQCGRENYIYS